MSTNQIPRGDINADKKPIVKIGKYYKYPGDLYYWVSPGWKIESHEVYEGMEAVGRFESEAAAQKWIDENKPSIPKEQEDKPEEKGVVKRSEAAIKLMKDTEPEAWVHEEYHDGVVGHYLLDGVVLDLMEKYASQEVGKALKEKQGWSDEDMKEAFRTGIDIDSIAANHLAEQWLTEYKSKTNG